MYMKTIPPRPPPPDAGSRQVAHQEVQIDQVLMQAKALDLPLIGVPLWPHIPYGRLSW